ncbi:PREDICTED: uncharacterized protein LOC109175639 [Ipomoea nil]|uniref:uncharacterized protein LOC109175639 n=1 Tax=Ipomoea nil TaxID=35883 RepID=UPI000901522F|nr:PREDICTED: uncharacterized protein LOC109175639 [Ipomoea nil]
MKDYKLINGKAPPLIPPFESDRNIGGVNIATVSPDHRKTNSEEITEPPSGHELKEEEEEEEDRVIKELKKIQRQNFLTHCLVSAMIVLTVTWQLSEMSLILKLKDGLNHPFRSLRGFVAGIFKGPVKDDEKPPNGKQKQDASPLPLSGPAISRLHY